MIGQLLKCLLVAICAPFERFSFKNRQKEDALSLLLALVDELAYRAIADPLPPAPESGENYLVEFAYRWLFERYGMDKSTAGKMAHSKIQLK